VLAGFTYKIKWPGSDHAMYITINDIERDGRLRPFEVFINSKNLEHYAWTVALTRMISAIFPSRRDVAFVVEELKAVFDPQGGQWMGGRYVPSLLAAIGQVIETHMIRTGFLVPETPAGRRGSPAQGAGLGRPWPRQDLPALQFPSLTARKGAGCVIPAATRNAVETADETKPGASALTDHAP
jgi:ribonucleoside-diphosphate reductase alpha chain